MHLNLINTEKVSNAFRKHFSLRMFFFFVLLSLVWSIRFPFVFRKIYAEDGAFFLADALSFRFPMDLLQPASGYSLLIQRIGGRFVSLFPLEFAPIVCGLFSALCLSFLAAGIFHYNNFATQDFLPRFTLSLCFIFLPLTSYSALGNVANLYIFFMAASAVFLYFNENTNAEIFYKSLIFFIAALSLPLTIFLLPILVHRSFLEKKTTGRWRIQKSDIALLAGLFSQFIFIMITSLGDRLPHSPNSLLKVVYLYFDRGIGISTVPKWGFVSGASGNISYEGSIDFLSSPSIRLLVVFVVLVVLLLIYLKSRAGFSSGIRSQLLFIPLLGFTYSLLVGLFFNPEPRYMIFTSFLTFWTIIVLFESQMNRKLRATSSSYLIMVLVLGLTASAHRSQGPDWKPELLKARKACSQINSIGDVKIRTLPIDALWEVTISCKNLGD